MVVPGLQMRKLRRGVAPELAQDHAGRARRGWFLPPHLIFSTQCCPSLRGDSGDPVRAALPGVGQEEGLALGVSLPKPGQSLASTQHPYCGANPL